MKKSDWLKIYNLWPPFLGAGIRISRIAPDLRSIEVKLKEHFWNRNYNGTHFGGSIYAMTDPFYGVMLIENLGPDYIVWDKTADIRFKKPGRGTLTATFNLTAGQIAAIKQEADTNYKTEPRFKVEIHDEEGDIVAEVDKTVYVRRRDRGITPHPPP